MAKLHDLEPSIMACWQITEELDVLFRHVCDGAPMTEDEIANILLGLRSLYDIKFNNLFTVYERVLKDSHGLSHRSD